MATRQSNTPLCKPGQTLIRPVTRWLGGLCLHLCLFLIAGSLSPALAQSGKPELVPPRRSYVPLKDLQALFEHDPRGVLLPRNEYESLLKQAETNRTDGPQPVGSLLGSCRYEAKVVGDQLLIQVTAEFEQFTAGWVSRSLPMQRLSIERAVLDDKPALIGRNDDRSLSLFTQGPGRHRLQLDLSTELLTVGSDRVAGCSLLPGATGEFVMTVEAGKRLVLDGAELQRPQPLDQPAEYHVAVGGKSQLQLRLTDRENERAADVLTMATSGYGLVVAPGEATWQVLTTLQIFGRPVDRLTLRVPKTVEVADVESTGLEHWELADDPENPQLVKLTLSYGQPFEGARKIAIRGVMALPTTEDWAVPTLLIENVTSHVGQVVVQHAAGVRLQVTAAEGVRRATEGQKAVSDMPEDMPTSATAQRLRFDAWQEAFTLRLAVAPKEREVSAAIASVLDVAAGGVQLQAAFTVTPRYAALFDVDIDVPAEWSVTSARTGGNLPLTWRLIPRQAGVNRIRVPLANALAAGATETVKLQLRRDVEGWPVEQEPVVFALPELVAPQASVVETAIVVRGDSDLEIAAEDVNGLDLMPLKAEWERLRFQSQDTRYSAQLKISRKPAQMAIETVGFYRLDRQTLATSLFATVTIQGGGKRELLVSLPETVPEATRFDVDGATLVEQQAVGVENGRRVWSLQLAERVIGQILVSTSFTLPRTAGVVTMACPLLEVSGADRTYGAIVVEAGPEQRLTMTAQDAAGLPLGEMDPLDLPPLPYELQERIVAVYRTIGDGNSLTLSEQRFNRAAVPTAVCTRLDMLTVLSRSGELQQRAEFQLRLAGVQQLQAELPDSTELWAATLDDEPVEIRRADGRFLMSLPNDLVGDTTATLRMFYRAATTALQGSGTLMEAPPALSVIASRGESQPIDVLEQTWELVHPKGTLVIENDTALEATSPLDRPGWILRIADLVRWPTGEDVLWGSIALAIVTGFFAALMLPRRYPSTTGCVTAVFVVGGIGFLLTILLTPGVQNARRAARSNAAPYHESTLDRIKGVVGEIVTDDFGDLIATAPTPTSAPADEVMDFAPLVEDRSQVRSENGERLREQMGLEDHVIINRTKPVPAPADPFDAPAKAAAEPAAPPVPQRAGGMMGDAIVAGNKPDAAEQQPADQNANGQPQVGLAVQPIVPLENKLSLQVRQSQGLLSLAINIDRPADSLEKTFRYVGGRSGKAGVPLQVEYLDRREGTAFRAFLCMLGLLAGWWLRRLSTLAKVTIAVCGLAVSCGLAPVVPVAWQASLDGLLCLVAGAAVAWTLACLGGCLTQLCRTCCGGWAAGLLALSLLAPSARAAEPAATKPAPPPTPFPSSQVLIYDDARTPLAADRVFVPAAKFAELYRLAHPELPLSPTAPAPFKAGIVESLYAARLAPAADGSDRSAVVTARYVIASQVDGQQAVTLPVNKVILKSAVLDDAPAAMITDQPLWQVLVPKPGLHVLDLEFVVPVTGNDVAGSLNLKLGATPAGRFSFTLPQPEHGVRVNGSTSAYRRVTRDGATLIELPIDAGGDLQIAWQPEQARGGAAVIHVESATAVSISDAGASASIGFQYRVRQGIVRDVSFRLPEGFQLQSVQGPDVGGWELTGEAAERRLRVFLRRNVNDATQLTLEGFLGQNNAADISVRVPEVTPLEITTEAGTIAIYATDAYGVRSENVTKLQQIDATGYKPAIPVSRINDTAQLAYRFSQRPWTIDIRGVRLATQLRTSVQQGFLVGLRKLQITARVRCDLQRMPRSSLVLQVPADWLVLDVQTAGLTDWYRTTETTDSMTASLTLDLDSPRQGQLDIVVTATQSRNPAEPVVSLGGVQVVDAQRQSNQLAVWLDAGLSGTVQEPGNWSALDATSISGELRQLRPATADLAFQSTSTEPTPVQIAITQLQPQLTASSLTILTVTDVALVYGCIFQWQIERAATETLSLEMPTWLADRLQFHAPEIRDAVPSPAGDGRTRWTIHLRGPVRNTFRIPATATLPPATEEVRSPGMQFTSSDQMAAQPLAAQRHYVLLINTSLSQLRAIDASMVEPVQRDDVDLVVRKELVDQATEFVRLKTPGVAPSWSIQRFVPAASLPAAVNLADLVTIVARDGSYRAVATYTIKNRRRQFLAVRIPDQSRLLSVLVSGQPSRAVTTTIGDRDALLIALPKASEVDLSFPVQVIYAGQLAKALPARSDLIAVDLDVPAAEVIRQDESEEFGIPVARTQWSVYLPDDLQATPLRDIQRHNLNLAARPDDVTAESMLGVLLNDADELLSAVDSLSSYSSKARAIGNLKQLDQALSSYARGTRGAESQAQAAKVKESLSKLERAYENAPVQTDGEPLNYSLSGNVADYERQLQETPANGGDASVQLGRAFSNNGIVILDNRNSNADFSGNGSDGINFGSSMSLNFGFQLSSPSSSPSSPTPVGKWEAPAAKGNTIQSRQLYQQLNESEIDRLNTSLADQKRKQDESGKDQQVQSDRFGRRNAPRPKFAPEQPPMNSFFGGQSPKQQVTPESGQQNLWMDTDKDDITRFRVMEGGMGGGIGGMGGGGGMGGMGPAGGGVVNNPMQAGWTQTGGLSLPFELPTAGQKLVFSKTGGDAKLAVRLRTEDSFRLGAGLIWAALCLSLAGCMLASWQRPQLREFLSRWAALAVAIVAAFGFITLAAPVNFLALLVFAIAVAVTLIRYSRRQTA